MVLIHRILSSVLTITNKHRYYHEYEGNKLLAGIQRVRAGINKYSHTSTHTLDASKVYDRSSLTLDVLGLIAGVGYSVKY